MIIQFLLIITGSVISLLTPGQSGEIDEIMQQSKSFSAYMVAGNFEGMMSVYTKDAKIFPVNRQILEGEELEQYWQRSPDSDYTVLEHKAISEQIKVLGDEAYDWGYYEGRSLRNGKESTWRGKYVIIWRKEDGLWKMYLDIWNRVPDQ